MDATPRRMISTSGSSGIGNTWAGTRRMPYNTPNSLIYQLYRENGTGMPLAAKYSKPDLRDWGADVHDANPLKPARLAWHRSKLIFLFRFVGLFSVMSFLDG
jgi:hypothetical protein